MADARKKDLIARWGELKTERSSWVSQWKEISEYLLPRSGRFFTSDRNNGTRKHNQIYDSTGTRALNVLAAGMMAGMTSPARPWFRLTTSIPELDEAASVKQWLADVTRLMQMVFAKSNTYRMLHSIYMELGAFGTAGNIMVQDYNTVMWNHPLTIGEYGIALNSRGVVDTLYREYDRTVRQLVGQYGLENCSKTVQNLYSGGGLDKWVTVIHAIEPREDRDLKARDAKNMPFRSVYFELGGDEDKVLRESGFRHFPGLCPRWAESGGDIYGNSPGMEALGDIKQLQHQQLRKSEVIDYKVRPPLQVPTSLFGKERDILPGGVTYYDQAAPHGGIRSAFEVNLDMQHLLIDIQDVRERIKSSFYADLFLMLANSTNTSMTATEVAERHEEKLLMLGPVLERLHNELLNPLIESTFDRMVEANVLPPPPQELQGMELNVEFVSMLAQAQRAIGTNSIDRFVGGLGILAQMKPEVLDKFDADQWADVYSDMLGVDPSLVIPSEQVAVVRQQRAEAAAQQQQVEQIQQGASAVRDLAAADTGGSNALTGILSQFSGYT